MAKRGLIGYAQSAHRRRHPAHCQLLRQHVVALPEKTASPKQCFTLNMMIFQRKQELVIFSPFL